MAEVTHWVASGLLRSRLLEIGNVWVLVQGLKKYWPEHSLERAEGCHTGPVFNHFTISCYKAPPLFSFGRTFD